MNNKSMPRPHDTAIDEVNLAKQPQRWSRRTLLQWLLAAGTASAIGVISAAALSVKRLPRATKSQEPVTAGDKLVFTAGTNKDRTVKRDLIEINDAALALPEGKDENQDNLIVLCRFEPSTLLTPTKLEWAAEGLVAYSAICTHLGCVAYYAAFKEGKPLAQLLCHCHGASYDPKRGAMVTAGPAPRPLPQLPIKLNELGEVIAAGSFQQPPGVVSKSELKRWEKDHKN